MRTQPFTFWAQNKAIIIIVIVVVLLLIGAGLWIYFSAKKQGETSALNDAFANKNILGNQNAPLTDAEALAVASYVKRLHEDINGNPFWRDGDLYSSLSVESDRVLGAVVLQYKANYNIDLLADLNSEIWRGFSGQNVDFLKDKIKALTK